MVSQNNRCPSTAELNDYLQGKLPDEVLHGLESHFAVCDQCEETLRGLGADDTFSRLAENAMSEQTREVGERDFVSKLVTQLRSDVRFRVQPRAIQERSAEVIRFLDQSDSPECLGRLANYRIERVLGAGSSGVVFYAVDESLNRPVALKVLRPSLGSAARQRFMIEARMTASVNHPQIVTIYQVGEERELAFIAMQWLPGETLESRLERVTFLPEPEVRAIASQIVSGLKAAHEKMLVHRDIKPANIWLCEKTGEVKILDFGLARISDDDPHLTSSGMLAGTPNFMSPEQTRGQELDGRTDLFSLGCLMYRAATGKLPFGETGILATLQAIQHQQPRSPIELNPNIGADFSDLVMCLLEKQPANRPSSALVVLEALNQPRANWKFSAASHPLESAPRDFQRPVNTSRSTKPASQDQLKWTRWVTAVVVVGLAAWGWNVYGQQIIRVATNRGEIVIDSNDKNISVEILKDGELIRVVDLKTEQKIEIKAGEYEIKAGKNGNENSISVQPNTLMMTRGGKQIVTISRTDPKIDAPGATSANRNEPTYDGRTIDQWISQMKYEQSLKFISDGAVAIGYLCRNDETKCRQALAWIRPLIREHGSKIMDDKASWPGIFNAFFTQISPRYTVEFAIEEIESGTEQSRNQVIWNLLLGTLYEGDSRLIVDHQNMIRENFPTIMDKALKLIESDRLDKSSHQMRDLLAIAIRSAAQVAAYPSPFYVPRDSGFSQTMKNLLEERLAMRHNKEIRAFLAAELVGMEVRSQLAVNEFCEFLSDPELPPELSNQMYYNRLALLNRDDIPQVVPALIKIYDNDVMCDRLAMTLAQSIASGQFGKESAPLSPEENRIQIRIKILTQLGNYREKANAALTWLDQLASQKSESKGDQALAQKALQAARQIRNLDLKEGGAEGDNSGGGTGTGARDEKGKGDSTNSSVINEKKSGHSEPAESPKVVEKTLQGSTLTEWMKIAETELDRKTLMQACISIGKLAAHDRTRAESAFHTLLELLESNWDAPVEHSTVFTSDPASTDVIIAATIRSLNKIRVDFKVRSESAFLDQWAVELVTKVVRERPIVNGIGSTSQGGKLIQDGIGDAACEFFARDLKPEQAIEFIEQNLVSGSDNSSFRLQHLFSESEFVTTINKVLPELIKSIEKWPAVAKSEAQKSNTHEFLRMGIFYLKNDEFKAVAESAMKALSNK